MKATFGIAGIAVAELLADVAKGIVSIVSKFFFP